MTRGLFSLSSAAAFGSGSAAFVRAARAETEGDAFIAGEENALVRVLAAAVEQPALRYNPIVLCGPTGVGKSTVARALASRRQATLDARQLIETSGADLARSLAHAIEVHATDEFRARHQRCAVLVVDDCHTLGGKPAAQQFLTSTIDALVRRGSLVIVTLAQSPMASRKLSPALASRLTAGLVVSLSHPGFEARCELVRRESDRLCLTLTETQVERLAGQTNKSRHRFLTAGKVRAAVFKLAAKALSRQSGALEPLTTIVPAADEKLICRQACNVVARHFSVTAGEIRGKSRCKSLADARAVAMYVAKEVAGVSFERIGKQFGGRDHTTVLHAHKKLTAAIEHDPVLRRLTDELASQVAAAAEP